MLGDAKSTTPTSQGQRIFVPELVLREVVKGYIYLWLGRMFESWE